MHAARHHRQRRDHEPERTPDGAPVHYERHRPEQSTLYRLVQRHAARFIAHTGASTGSELPRFIKDEFDAFLECGVLAREWCLHVSAGRGKTSAGVEEPALFNEPGLFLVRPDGRLYWGTVSTMHFGRPHLDEILQAIGYVIAKGFPARGAA